MVTAQLSLFATSPAVGTLYKAGDWVKLRKKPSSAAAWVKRGEVFRIESVHPVDGSMRFWNPHINEWGFLYPDEVSLVPAPNDSVSEAIAPVDTESNSPNDSVSEAIAPVEVDTESNSPNDSVSGCKAISTYRPRGTARSGEYFRFSYRDGSRMRHIHIRGGNTDSPIAQARVEEVRSLLAAGAKSAEIVEMLRGGA
ncbi:MAG: hypothetical protein JGK38_16045 [Microcoleus sp. PH2017_15_JOR_U_A]|uniref:hypothetical protein n=1 Tax=Microcoleus sp. PH2017_15_JOR_U_A TaxID=2798826 RepID=UPI001E00F25C|nr:hypothetical protein [Microcoleus sp. PH2017_15_JOR_U_A]MCC3498110.1 hypothetical protein [Microcoleus sp. PH2017_15_JOR_U_A]